MSSWPERFELVEGGATVTVRLATSNATTQYRAALNRYAPHLEGKIHVTLERHESKPWRAILTLRLRPEPSSTTSVASTPSVTEKLHNRDNPEGQK